MIQIKKKKLNIPHCNLKCITTYEEILVNDVDNLLNKKEMLILAQEECERVNNNTCPYTIEVTNE